LRIECRFIEDEDDVYSKVLKEFYIPVEDGYYHTEDNPYIQLNLDKKQPQVQKMALGYIK